MILQGRVEKMSVHDVVEAKETAEQVVKQRALASARKIPLASGSISVSSLSDSELSDSELPDLLKVSEVSELSMATISMLAASV